MRIDEFNALPAEEAVALLESWAAIPTWAHSIAERRPFRTAAALRDAAAEASCRWAADDLAAALSRHPRIGERVEGSGADAEASRREQAAMAVAQDDVAQRMTEVNAAYEDRFGRVFLIRAAGRRAEEMLAEAQRRLGNDPDAEVEEAVGQLREIMILRLEAAISGVDEEEDAADENGAEQGRHDEEEKP